jgi:5-methylcytosine-specific restriction endonuclease McrA
MGTGAFWELEHVSDQQVRCELATLLASGYRTEARIVAHIAEVEGRKLHAKDGSPSLFEYCVKQLGLSENEAFHRLTAARIARRFPVVFSLLERRELHLTAVCLLRDYLTPGNHLELLKEAAHKTKFQVLELLARRFPRPDVASTMRKLPKATLAKQPSALLAPEPGPTAAADIAPAGAIVIPHAAPSTSPPRPAPARVSIEPTSESRYRIQLNASSTLKEKLELLRALTSHSNPDGDLAVVIERAVDLALAQVQKQRFAKTDVPRAQSSRAQSSRAQPTSNEGSSPSPNPRSTHISKRRFERREHIPHAMKREIAARDGLRCTYTSDTGCRCAARAFLQIHHEKPWARGGASNAQNIRLLCAAHNRLLAERDFGPRHIAEQVAAARQLAQTRQGRSP